MIVVGSTGFGFRANWIVGNVAPYAKRTDPEFYPGFGRLNRIVQHFYGYVDILAAPVSQMLGLKTSVIHEKRSRIRKWFCQRIRIKIIIHVNGIQIIASNDVANNFRDKGSHFRNSRIEIQFIPIF